jgi:hypothetical protein
MLPTGPVGTVPDVGLEPRSAAAKTSDATAAQCVSRRRFAIRVRPTSRAIRSVTVRVGGRKVAARRVAGTKAARGRFTATVDLRRFGRRTVTVTTRAVLRAKDGKGRARVVTDTRRYRTCGA